MAFPGAERLAFEREVLFPLAGLDPAGAAEYAEVRALMRKLSHAGNEAARGYLDGELDRAAAEALLVRYTLATPAQAAEKIPLLDPSSILGAYHVPSDGIAKGVRIATALGRKASDEGVAFELAFGYRTGRRHLWKIGYLTERGDETSGSSDDVLGVQYVVSLDGLSKALDWGRSRPGGRGPATPVPVR